MSEELFRRKAAMLLNRKTPLNTLALILGLFPLVWLAGVISFALRAWDRLSYWPKPHHPDPQILPFTTHYDLLQNTMFGNVLSFLGLLFFWAFLPSLLDRRALVFSSKLLLVGWAMILAATLFSSVGVVAWFLR